MSKCYLKMWDDNVSTLCSTCSYMYEWLSHLSDCIYHLVMFGKGLELWDLVLLACISNGRNSVILFKIF